MHSTTLCTRSNTVSSNPGLPSHRVLHSAIKKTAVSSPPTPSGEACPSEAHHFSSCEAEAGAGRSCSAAPPTRHPLDGASLVAEEVQRLRTALGAAKLENQSLRLQLREVESQRNAAQEQLAKHRQEATSAKMGSVTLRAERDELVVKLEEAYDRLAMLARAFHGHQQAETEIAQNIHSSVVALLEHRNTKQSETAVSLNRNSCAETGENEPMLQNSEEAVAYSEGLLHHTLTSVAVTVMTVIEQVRKPSAVNLPTSIRETIGALVWAEEQLGGALPLPLSGGVANTTRREANSLSVLYPLCEALRTFMAFLRPLFLAVRHNLEQATTRREPSTGDAPLARLVKWLQCAEDWSAVESEIRRLKGLDEDKQSASLVTDDSLVMVVQGGMLQTPPRQQMTALSPSHLPPPHSAVRELLCEAVLLMGRAYSGMARDVQDLLTQREFLNRSSTGSSLYDAYRTSPLLRWRVGVTAVLALGRLKRLARQECCRVVVPGAASGVGGDEVSVRLRLPPSSRVCLTPIRVHQSSIAPQCRLVSPEEVVSALRAAIPRAAPGLSSREGEEGMLKGMSEGEQVCRLLVCMQELMEPRKADGNTWMGKSLADGLRYGLNTALIHERDRLHGSAPRNSFGSASQTACAPPSQPLAVRPSTSKLTVDTTATSNGYTLSIGELDDTEMRGVGGELSDLFAEEVLRVIQALDHRVTVALDKGTMECCGTQTR